jgi:hypothetical protein
MQGDKSYCMLTRFLAENSILLGLSGDASIEVYF